MSHEQQPTPPHHERRRWIELSVPQLLAGALAAASAAFAASWLGVAGTVLGAVVASIVVSVSTAVYSRPIERSSQVIRESMPVIPVLPDRYRERSGTATETLVLGTTVQEVADDATSSPSDRPNGPATTAEPDPAPRRPRWMTVAVGSLAVLVVGFGILTGFEALVGKSASSITGGGSGGSTISRIVEQDNGSSSSDNDKPTDPTKPADGGSVQPTDPDPSQPTDPEPTEPTDPTPTEPTPTEPTPTEPTPTQPSAPGAGETVPQDGQTTQDTPGSAIATDPA